VVTLDVGEAQLMEAIRDLSRLFGLRVFHCYDARRGWGRGYPDLTIAGNGGVIFRECKTERGKTSAEQDDWAVVLQAAGQDWAIWRPSDLTSGRIQRELEKVRGR
jgi:hypothetical protein